MWNADPRKFSLEGNLLVRNHRIVIPVSLREYMLKELHVSHFGVVKMKANAREGHCWCPNMNKEIELLVQTCEICRLLKNNPPKVRTLLRNAVNYYE